MAKTIAIGNYAGALLLIDSTQKKFIHNFEVLVNTGEVGMPILHANWSLVTAKDKDSCQAIKDQTMPNTHIRKFLDQFLKLTAFCLSKNLPRQQQWNQTMEHWNLMVEGSASRTTSIKRWLTISKI
jgi:hypothetical protein